MVNHRSDETRQPGYTNRHAQNVVRDTGLRGTEQGQTAYVLECEQCQHRYATNASDVIDHRCPKCQSGKTGIAIDARELARDA